MSEKKIRIETTGEATDVEKTPAERKRKGLPAAGEAWKASEHDMVVMGRLSRAIEGVPPAAMRRIAPWFSSLLAEAMREPTFEGAKLGQVTQGVQQWPGWGNASAQLANAGNPQAQAQWQVDQAKKAG